MKLFTLLITLLLSVSSFAKINKFIIKLKDKTNINEFSKDHKGKLNPFTQGKTKYFSHTFYYTTDNAKELIFLKQDSRVDYAEEIVMVKAKAINPSTNTSSFSNDPLLPYQWGLYYQDQEVLNEVSDIQNRIIPGSALSDIGLESLEAVDKKLKRDVIVAVIDSGIDFNHPDLKGNILKNEIECDNGSIPWGDLKDKDGNGFAGDCMGWDFTGNGEVGDNRPEDFVGHGTHVAGIISAVSNNGVGVSGLSNRLKILPIKVLSNKASDSQTLGASDRLAKSILYAVKMKADVINLSLGWPISFDKEHLQNAVKEALDKDITVIAAAGNNDHSAPIFPCAYDKVICVGSVDPNAMISDFSNFGGHVDILAPGNNILSTYPQDETPLFFDVKGYEIKSGTSQAAPYVSALAALIKGRFEGIDEKSVKARLYSSSDQQIVSQKKYTAFGKINVDQALKEKYQGFYAPVFKSLGRVKVDYKTKSFSLPLILRQYGEDAKLDKVTISSSQAISFDSNEFELSFSDDEVKLELKGTFSDLNIDFKHNLKVTLTGSFGTKTYTNEYSFFVQSGDIPGVIEKSISGALSKEILGLNTVYLNHMKTSSIHYYATQKAGDRGTIFSLFHSDDRRIFKAGMAMLRGATQVLSVHRLDMNFDGKEDYMIRSLVEEGKDEDKVQSIQYSYFTDRLKPLFGTEKKSNWKVKFENVILQDFDDFALVPYESSDYGKILIPVFMAAGPTPEANSIDNPFHRLYRKTFVQSLYYYVPEVKDGKTSLTLRTLNTIPFNKKFKRKVKHKPFDRIFFLKFYKQSFEDIKEGRFSILTSVEGSKRAPRNYSFTVTDLINNQWEITKYQTRGRQLSKYFFDRTINLDASMNIAHSSDLGMASSIQAGDFLWEQVVSNAELGEVNYVLQKDKANPLQIPIKTYVSSESEYKVFQAPSSLYFEIKENGKTQVVTYPVHISSFLPGVLFREQNYPIVYKDHEKSHPALYVDATQIASRNIYTIIAKGKNIVAPIKLNIDVPKLCKPKNPQVLADGHTYYAMLCFYNRGNEKMVFIKAGE